MARKIGKNHYIASTRGTDSLIHTPVHLMVSSAYSDGDESHRALSETTLSEYTSLPYIGVPECDQNEKSMFGKSNIQFNERPPYKNPIKKTRSSLALNRSNKEDDNKEFYDHHRLHPRARYEENGRDDRYDDIGSDIYVTSGAYRGYTNKAPSEISRISKPRAPSRYSCGSVIAPSIAGRMSRASTIKSGKSSHKEGVTIETMASPNPFCPNVKGMCCLMLLLNLGIILVTLGFVIVIQFSEPVFVWVLGLVFLIFGFLTLIGSLIYCVVICRDIKSPKDVNPDELFWTHYWSKTIGSSPSDIHYKSETEKYLDDRYSDRYSVGKMSKISDREGEKYEKNRF